MERRNLPTATKGRNRNKKNKERRRKYGKNKMSRISPFVFTININGLILFISTEWYLVLLKKKSVDPRKLQHEKLETIMVNFYQKIIKRKLR